MILKGGTRKSLFMKKFIKTYPILFLLFISLIFPSQSHTDVDPFSATLIDYNGDVSIQKEKSNEWLDVVINMPIQQEDNIITGEGSYAEIFVDDGSTIKVEESSEINLRELVFDEDSQEVQIEIFLKAGILFANIVEAIQQSPSVKVYTNTAVAGVRGTEFVVDASDPKETNIGVFSGEVEAFGLDDEGNVLEDEPVSIEEGYQTTVLRNNTPHDPIVHKKRMLLFKNRIKALRKNTIKRRRNISEIVQKRNMIKRRIIMNNKGTVQKSPAPDLRPKRPIRPIRRRAR